jgi:hypothetical protein
MLKNDFRAAIRFLLRSKTYTLINISGLATGMLKVGRCQVSDINLT